MTDKELIKAGRKYYKLERRFNQAMRGIVSAKPPTKSSQEREEMKRDMENTMRLACEIMEINEWLEDRPENYCEGFWDGHKRGIQYARKCLSYITYIVRTKIIGYTLFYIKL